jgi:hypothetical protein
MPVSRSSAGGITAAQLAAKLPKAGEPPAYTQTFSTAARTHVEPEMSTSLSIALLTEVAPILNAQNKAINELKKLVNALIDDAQANGLAK